MNKQYSWEDARDKALRTVCRFLDTKDEKLLPQVKVATSTLSNYTRHEATESARQQTAVIVARSLSDNKEEFRRYLELSSVGLNIPQLPEITEGESN